MLPGAYFATVSDSVVGFAGLIGMASLWSIWNGDTFPAEPDPKGGKLT